MSKESVLIEWYDGGAFGNLGIRPPITNLPPAEEPGEEKEREEPEEKAGEEVERIENQAELLKAAAIARAMENKLTAISGVFDIDDDRKTKIKTEIKELSKKVEEIVSKI